MSLLSVNLDVERLAPGDEIQEFLEEADLRVKDYLANNRQRATGFVPCDFEEVFHTLRAVVQENVATGERFCEWGSGLGVVAMLAALLGLESYGIEIRDGLVEASRELAEAFDLDVEFIRGSFIPPGSESVFDEGGYGDVSWIEGDADEAYSELGLGADAFDIVFAYPWPGEERVIETLFDDCAADGALLLTFSQLDGVRVARKMSDETDSAAWTG